MNAKGKSFAGVAICAALLAGFALNAHLAWKHTSATFDEPTHFIASILQCQEHDFRADPENPPLWRYFIGLFAKRVEIDRRSPLWDAMLQARAAEGTFVRQTLYSTPANDPDGLIGAARARMIGLGCALGAMIAWWAWRLGGWLAAVVAVGAFCFDPNFLANAAIVKNDVPLTLCLMVMLAAVWRMGEGVTWTRWIVAALAASAAVATKSSGIIAIAIFAVLLAARAMLNREWKFPGGLAKSTASRMGLAAVLTVGIVPIAWATLWAAYQFRFSPTPDPNAHFELRDILQTLAKGDWVAANGGATQPPADISPWMTHWQPGLTVRLALWMLHHHFLPEAFLVGFLHLYGISHIRVAFLLGHNSYVGWWYYFPVAIALKTPLATLAGLLLAMVNWLRRKTEWRFENWWALIVAAAGPGVYLAAAMASHISVGLRHVLPVYPFLFIFLGVSAADVVGRRGRRALVPIAILGAGLAVESLAAFPDYLPFFNLAAGGSRGGLALLGDSNIDGGQELPALAAWQRKNGDRLLYLCYFGTADPRYYGIRYVNLPASMAPPDQEIENVTARTPGAPMIAVSAAMLQDPLVPAALRETFARLRQHPPLAVLGGSIYLFNVVQ
jgi:hypothetical protein